MQDCKCVICGNLVDYKETEFYGQLVPYSWNGLQNNVEFYDVCNDCHERICHELFMWSRDQIIDVATLRKVLEAIVKVSTSSES